MALGVGIGAVLALGGGTRGIRTHRIGACRRGSCGSRLFRRCSRCRCSRCRRGRRDGSSGRCRGSGRSRSRGSSRSRCTGSGGSAATLVDAAVTAASALAALGTRTVLAGDGGGRSIRACCGCSGRGSRAGAASARTLDDAAVTAAGALAALGTRAVLAGDGGGRSIHARCGCSGRGSRRRCAGAGCAGVLVDPAMTTASALATLGTRAVLAGDGGGGSIRACCGCSGRGSRRRRAGAGPAGTLVDAAVTAAGALAALGACAVLAGDGCGRGVGIDRRRGHSGDGKNDGSQNEIQCISHEWLPSVSSGLSRVAFILVASAAMMRRARCRFNVGHPAGRRSWLPPI
ncbi:MAG: hypothetical protein JWR07_2837 [Nevskia sp.]|nr:hypothetical protein [Nevskia sp.]